MRRLHNGIWEHPGVLEMNELEKLLFIGMIVLADDWGRGSAEICDLHEGIFRYDALEDDELEAALQRVCSLCAVRLYRGAGMRIYQLLHWNKWQRVSRPRNSRFPPPPVWEDEEKG